MKKRWYTATANIFSVNKSRMRNATIIRGNFVAVALTEDSFFAIASLDRLALLRQKTNNTTIAVTKKDAKCFVGFRYVAIYSTHQTAEELVSQLNSIYSKNHEYKN